MGKILLTREKPDERPAPAGRWVADGAPKHRVSGLDRIENRRLRDGAWQLKEKFPLDPSQGPQMKRQLDPDHFRVCTSTDNTAGRSRTIAFQVSPESDDA